ncbi:MAG: radical SAM protein [Deltaproteobacteria bacterium]|nr:radical SAM protein [Deltaproteobacteria bacterium]
MEEISYSRFISNVDSTYEKKRLPLSCQLEITFKCNVNCNMCYCKDLHEPNELSTGEIKDLLDVMAEAGTLWLTLTGGDIFMRKDFNEIYLYAVRKGFIITLFTNGVLIDEKRADLLAEYPPYKIEVSLYGATQETYEAVTRTKGSFKRCLEGVNLLKERGLNVRLKSPITKTNHHEYWKIKDLAEKITGNYFRFDPMINPKLDYSQKVLEERIPPKEVVKLDLVDPHRRREWIKFARHFDFAPNCDHTFLCGAGKQSFHIDPQGRMDMCSMARHYNYDLREGGPSVKKEAFHKAFYELFPQWFNKRKSQASKCNTCPVINFCNRCPGALYLEAQNDEQPVAYYCQSAYLRHKVFTTLAGKNPPATEYDYLYDEEIQAIVAQCLGDDQIIPEHELTSTDDLPRPPSACGSCGSGGCGSKKEERFIPEGAVALPSI